MVALLAVVFSKPVLALAGLAGGFGLGRVKNAKKLADAKALLVKAEAEGKLVEAKVGAEAAKLFADVKAKL